MPLYEYRCAACDGRFEFLQPLGGDAQGLACPSCGGRELRRELSTFAAHGGGREAEPVGCGKPGCGTEFACRR